MLKLTIEIEAKSHVGLETSIEEVLRVVKNGNTSGFDGNDDESYSFSTTGYEEPEEEQDED